jgi:hypothetical protein
VHHSSKIGSSPEPHGRDHLFRPVNEVQLTDAVSKLQCQFCDGLRRGLNSDKHCGLVSLMLKSLLRFSKVNNSLRTTSWSAAGPVATKAADVLYRNLSVVRGPSADTVSLQFDRVLATPSRAFCSQHSDLRWTALIHNPKLSDQIILGSWIEGADQSFQGELTTFQCPTKQMCECFPFAVPQETS